MSKVLLCADELSLRLPQTIGLEGEVLDGQDWLLATSNACEARELARRDSALTEAWVLSLDDVEAINAAAAMKKDRDDLAVFLVSPKNSGSLQSRSNAAGLNAVITMAEFVTRYMAKKAIMSGGSRGVDGSRGATGARASEEPRPAEKQRAVEVPKHEPAAKHEPAPKHGPAAAAPVARLASEAAAAGSPASVSLAPVGKDAYLIVVAGASGGCGKSAVSATMSCAAAAAGCRTLLLDADSQFGDVARLLGCKEALSTDEVIADSSLMRRIGHEPGKPDVLAAPRFLEQEELVSQGLKALLCSVRTSYDVIVVNTGAHWGEMQLQLFEMADNVLFLVDQRPSSIHASRHALALCSRCGVATSPFIFAVNRCGRAAVFTSIDVSCAMDGIAVEEILDGGMEVEEALCAGDPSALLRENPFGMSVAKVLFTHMPALGCLDQEKACQMSTPHKKRFAFRKKMG